jgi:hypothetical protein
MMMAYRIGLLPARLFEDTVQRAFRQILMRMARNRHSPAGMIRVRELPVAASLPRLRPTLAVKSFQNLPDLHSLNLLNRGRLVNGKRVLLRD